MIAYRYFILKWPSLHLSLQLVESFIAYKDQILKVDVLTGNSISKPKFCFVYRFPGENGKSLALTILPFCQNSQECPTFRPKSAN